MSCVMGNKIEIRRRALLQAVRFCGGVTGLSRCLKVSRTRVSNWVNHPEIEMPYEYALITENITQVSVERLSPFTEVANKIMRRLRSQTNSPLGNMELSEIWMGEEPYLKWQEPVRPIIVGTDRVLISGLTQLEMCKAKGMKQVAVLVLDLEALLLERRMIQDSNFHFSISEHIAIGLRLENLLGSYQGKRNDLKTSATHNGDLKGRKDIRVAKIIGFSTNSYYRARQVYMCGNLDLIAAMDRKEISIAFAARQINALKTVQLDHQLKKETYV